MILEDNKWKRRVCMSGGLGEECKIRSSSCRQEQNLRKYRGKDSMEKAFLSNMLVKSNGSTGITS